VFLARSTLRRKPEDRPTHTMRYRPENHNGYRVSPSHYCAERLCALFVSADQLAAARRPTSLRPETGPTERPARLGTDLVLSTTPDLVPFLLERDAWYLSIE
jgi:hypothetical protein